MSEHARILLGAMSGTSADGVDVAAVEITGRGLGMQAKYLAHVEHAYAPELRRRIFDIRGMASAGQEAAARLGAATASPRSQTRSGEAVPLEELAKLGRDITLAYAEATRELLKQMSLAPARVVGLAAHGQTLYHAPPESIQWLDPSLLAAQTDVAVISDFRRADLAVGGQGAPLVPFGDWILFRHPEKTRVVLNIGGIANLTYLPAGGGIEDVIAFDTGPGCCILDDIVRRMVPGATRDEEGRLASRGKPMHDLLSIVTVGDTPETSDFRRYLEQAPPKSTDPPAIIAAWHEAEREARRVTEPFAWAPQNLLATAVFFTACNIVDQLRRFAPPPKNKVAELIAAGGGTRNQALMARLADQLDWSARHRLDDPTFWAIPLMRYRLKPISSFGLPSQAREAVCFAILGAATLDGEPSSVPSATGAARRVVLGSVTPPPGG